MLESYLVHVLILIGIYSILAVSLNFVIGYGGLLNLGHVAFFGIGAYSSALLMLSGVPFFVALVLSGLLASGCGCLLAQATGRVKGDYLALVTLGFSFIVYSLMQNLTSITAGPLGIPGIPRPSFLGISVGNGCYLLITGMILLITYLIIRLLVMSDFGTMMGGVRDNQLLMSMLGKNVAGIKTKAMMISAFFAGIAGSLYAHYIGFIDPSSFGTREILLLLTIVLLGGLASLEGTIIATVLLVSIPESLRFIAIPNAIVGPARAIIYALALLMILSYRPKGILGKVDLG